VSQLVPVRPGALVAEVGETKGAVVREVAHQHSDV
jgi:hypothetical protein